ncbi:hypothetical protein B0J13DRAFT_679676 [Dactylonectria estremocensis]|uniref:VOC domain-containing protein n=1 Tax=Dactylonectria estremocensis TaxID=1079267 RepID=A0A9P9DWN2_9HYPO|nr:hypothetical protein B0J13DRAFT_679676 [Dactylonectria estremocensis]
MVRMLSGFSAATALLAASNFISPSLACIRSVPSNGTVEYPYPELGTDAYADPETTGYFINHFSLNVMNLTASVDFYSQIFGLRKIFTLHVSEHYSITYMGHSHGGKNGTGHQTADELNREKNNSEGLLELIHLDVPGNDLPASTKTANTFGHIGMVVPDIEATQKRLEAHPGVEIVKGFNEDMKLPSDVATSTSLSPEMVALLDPAEVAFIMAVLAPATKGLIFVNDPDGNMIEIQPQEGAALV